MTKRVLIVEDDPDLAQTLAEVLERRYEVEIARDGVQAVERLDRQQFDAVILDLMLPRLPGEAVLEQIRQRGLAIPVLIATARDDGGEVMARGGARDWLRKPFPMPLLLEKLARALGEGDPTGGTGSARPPTGSGRAGGPAGSSHRPARASIRSVHRARA
jgi:two-component system response regulator MprA